MVVPTSFRGVLDGELLAGTPQALGSFNDLQQRLNRKKPSAKVIAQQPVFMRCYDQLLDGREDIRPLPLHERRSRLEAHTATLPAVRFDISPLIKASSWQELDEMRLSCREKAAGDRKGAGKGEGLIEGLMLKRKSAPYQLGRIKGQWFKWKRDPLYADLVILYAQRGHGKRSSKYSDFTFGAWQETETGRVLVPVGKAYSGFSDAELTLLDKFVRTHTVAKFGPVREVEHKLVIEAAFDSLHASSRHKSGVAMRFPRFHAIRWDKDAEEADTLETLRKLIT